MTTQAERLRAYKDSQNPAFGILARIEMLKGDKGDIGPMGPAGKDGKNGLDGRSITGPRGPQGAPGVRGERGSDGSNGINGKDGQNGISPTIDYQKIIADVISQLTSGKKLKPEHIDGLTKGLGKLEEFLKLGGYRGGGDTIAAGTGVTISIDVNGKKVINASAASGGFQQPTGTVNGSNQVFVWATAPKVIIVDQGRPMQKVSSDGTVNWTIVGTTTTLSIAPTFDIFGIS